MPAKRKYIWEKKTDTELQFWPSKSTELYLSAPTLPAHLVGGGKSAKVAAPEPLPEPILESRGIINAAFTEHKTAYYQARANETFSIAIFTTAGRAQVKSGGKKIALTRGTVFVAPADSEYVLSSTEKWSNIWFHLGGSPRWKSLAGREPFAKKSSRIDDIKSAARMWLSEARKSERSLRFLRLAADLIAQCVAEDIAPDAPFDSRGNFGGALREIIASGEKISAKDAARKLGKSVYALERACVKARGEKFAKIGLAERMERARAALSAGEPVAKAAAAAGYADRSSFSKAFKRAFKISPSDFR